MKYDSIYNNFSSGELSRYLKGRTDIEEYFKGVEEMTNWLPIKQGGITLRPGTEISGETGNFTQPHAIFPFSPREGETYILTLFPSNVVGFQFAIKKAGAAAATITAPSYIWNKRIDFTSSTASYDRTTDTDPSIILDNLQVLHSGDVCIILDGTGQLAPIVILRKAFNTFIIDSMIWPQQVNADTGLPYFTPPFIPSRVPYKDSNIDTNLRLKPSAASGNITITSENASAVAKSYFKGDVVGMYVRITHASVTGIARITSKVSDSVVNATVIINFGATTASSNFDTSAWNPVDGYPRCGAFHEGRLFLGGSIGFPDTIWASLTGNIYHFMAKRFIQDATTDVTGLNYFGSAKSTDAFNFIPASDTANTIRWIYPSDTLLVGTSETEFSVSSGTESSISFDSIFIKSLSRHGSSGVKPVKIGSAILFVTSDGKRLMEIPKRLVEYTGAAEISSISEGIVDKAIDLFTTADLAKVKNKIYKMVWQESEATLWLLCKNSAINGSTLISLTYDKTAKVVAWAKHKIAGCLNIYSMCLIKDSLRGNYSFLYLMLSRDTATYHSLEVLTLKNVYDKMFIYNEAPSANLFGKNVIYLDGSYFYYNPAFVATDTEITLDLTQTNVFPSSQVYSVLCSKPNSNEVDQYLGTFTPTAGVITIPNLDPTNRLFIVGVFYDNQVKTMPSEAGAQFGVAQGSKRRTHETSLFLDRSIGGQYTQANRNDFLDFVYPSHIAKGLDNLFTGEIKLSLNASTDDTQTIFKQDKPYPMTILWMLQKGYTYDT